MREWMILVTTPWRDIIVANSKRCSVSHNTGRISSFADMEGLIEINCWAISFGKNENASYTDKLNARILMIRYFMEGDTCREQGIESRNPVFVKMTMK